MNITVRAIKDNDLEKFAERLQGRLQAGFKIMWVGRSDTAHYMYEALVGYEEPQDSGKNEIGLVTLPDCIELYNQGYNAGHNDTVESCYTPVVPQDMRSYHEEKVVELLKEMS